MARRGAVQRPVRNPRAQGNPRPRAAIHCRRVNPRGPQGCVAEPLYKTGTTLYIQQEETIFYSCEHVLL